MFDVNDTSEYYGGCYDDPPEYDEEYKKHLNYGEYFDYVYDSYRDEMLLKKLEENDNE